MMTTGTWQSQTDRMIAVLGHELRNPLSAGMAGISAAAELTDPSDPRHSFLERALRDLGRLSSLLDRYLEFGRSGSVVGNLVHVADLANQIPERAGTRVVVRSAKDVVVHADPALLERAFENLIDNAAKAGASRVVFTIEECDGRATIDVHDDGRGVPPELADRIFDPFVSDGTGSGLGLALVAEVLESHGGSIQSVPSTHGARFRINLPSAPRTTPA